MTVKAVLLISHGSHSPKTKAEVKALLKVLKKKWDLPIWHYAFLEIESPNIPEGIDYCVEKGANEIVILLNFLNSGKHVDEDIPRIIDEARKKYAGVKFHITEPAGQHPLIANIFLELIPK